MVTIRTGAMLISALTILYFFINRHKTENLHDADGNNFAYSGDVNKNDQPDGAGKAVYKNGNVYDGEWTFGKFDGKGTLTFANGEVYTGYFKNGYRNGNGKFTYQNGTVYDGNWQYDSWSGAGKTTWLNGDEYVGSFKDGYRDGYGVYSCPAGEIYNCPGCKKYEGNWRRNLKEGTGRCYDSRGNVIYSGYFSNDRPVSTYPAP
jgi:hypothetical protein